MKKLISLALTLTLSIGSVSLARAQEEGVINLSSNYSSEMALTASWVQIMPGTNVRNASGDIVFTTEALWLTSATSVIQIESGDFWVEIQFTIPGKLGFYYAYVHESRISDNYLVPAAAISY